MFCQRENNIMIPPGSNIPASRSAKGIKGKGTLEEGIAYQQVGKMRVLVLNGSPAGENSITLQTVRFIEIFSENAEFEVLHVGQKIKTYEKDFAPAAEALEKADLIIFCYPVYTFLVPAQLHRFIELIRENEIDVSGKYATQVSTSKHFYDTTAHAFIRDISYDLGLRYIRGLSADMEDLLNRKGQKEALAFFRYVRWNMKQGFCEPDPVYGGIRAKAQYNDPYNENLSGKKPPRKDILARGRRIAIVADLPESKEGSALREMVDRFVEKSSAACDVINIREFPFRGGCLGCFHCAADGICIYKDGFDSFLRENIQKADAVIYAFTVRDHSMGSLFKTFDDRQFCNGHRTVTMGKPVGYLVEGDLSRETNLQTVMEARAQVGGNFLTGIACSGPQMEAQVFQLAMTMGFALAADYNPPRNFYGVGGMKIFRDLIYQMQGMMKADHRFYKEHHFYDFPQKRKGMIAGMYLVGAMMNNRKLKKIMGGKMTEGMLMPYRNVIEKAGRRN